MTQERPRDGRNEFETFKERGLNSRFVLLGQDVYTMLKSGPFFKGGGRGRGNSSSNSNILRWYDQTRSQSDHSIRLGNV